MLDYDLFEKAMTALSTLPQGELSDDRMDAYYIALCDLPADGFIAGVNRCLRECRFFPAPIEIRERAEATMADNGRILPEPETAWVQVERLARRWSPYGGTELPDNAPLRRAVEDLGGMTRIAAADAGDMLFLRRDFIAKYREYRRRCLSEQAEAVVRSLPASVRLLDG